MIDVPPDATSDAGRGEHAATPEASGVSTLDAISECYDVVVAGAGIAGATAARLFAARGLHVLLVERDAFPRYKVCGSCLNTRSLGFLEAAGLRGPLEARGAVAIDTALLAARRTTASIPLPGGLAVSRALLDTLLVETACARGARFLPKTSVALGTVLGATREVTLTQGNATRTVQARLVIAAGGLQGALIDRTGEGASMVSPAARIGVGTVAAHAPASFEPGIIYMACGRRGYAGLVRVEAEQLAIAAALDRDFVRSEGGPGPAVARLLAESALSAPPDFAGLTWKGTPPLTRRATRLAAERVLVTGDAGGYVEPFTGEGMAWAFASAHEADALLDGELDVDWRALGAVWERSRRSTMRRQRLLCRALARTLRSPIATGALVGLLSRSAQLSRPFVRMINAQTRS